MASDNLHRKPTRPGWQILLDAANTVINERPNPENTEVLLRQISCRIDETLPDEHRDEVCNAIIAAAPLFHILDWHPLITIFLDVQIGKEEIAARIKGSRFELKPCPIFPSYRVSNSELSERERSLLTHFTRKGPVMVDTIRNRPGPDASKN